MQGSTFDSMTSRSARRLALAAAVALALACAAPAAIAQPAGGSPGGPGMHAMHGMHDGGSLDALLPHLLHKAKAALNLNTSQQVQWDNAVAQGKLAHTQMRANRQQAKDALKAELAKPAPDLAALAASADAIEQQNRTLRRDARAPWLALYATFSPEQKAVVRDLLQQRLERAESFRERMHDHVREALRPAS
jgi:Spy/CpxP family protein refolding chaperone